MILFFISNPCIVNNIKTSEKVFGLPESVASILIPALVSILIFVLGILISWMKRKHEKRQETISYRNVILNWIDQIETVVNQQIDYCNDFAKRVEGSETIYPERLSSNKLLVDKIIQIPIEKFIYAFVTNSSGNRSKNYKMTFKLIGQFDFLNNIEKQIPEVHHSYQTQLLEIMEEWNKNFESFDNLVSNQTHKISNTHGSLDKTSFHYKVLEIANMWYSSSGGSSQVTFTMTNLIEPLSEIIGPELKQTPDNKYAFDLSAILQNLRITYTKWQTLNSEFSISFRDIANKIGTSYSELKSSKSHFIDSTKVKNIFQLS